MNKYWHYTIISDSTDNGRDIYTNCNDVSPRLEELYFKTMDDAIRFIWSTDFYWPWSPKDQDPDKCKIVYVDGSNKYVMCDSVNPMRHVILSLEELQGIGPIYGRWEEGRFIFSTLIVN